MNSEQLNLDEVPPTDNEAVENQKIKAEKVAQDVLKEFLDSPLESDVSLAINEHMRVLGMNWQTETVFREQVSDLVSDALSKRFTAESMMIRRADKASKRDWMNGRDNY